MHSLYSFTRRLPALIGIVILLALHLQSIAQVHLEYVLGSAADTRFEEVKAQMEKYFERNDRGKGSGYKQWKRYEWWQSMHLEADGRVGDIQSRNAAAMAWMQEQPQMQSANSSWSVIGPTWNQGTGTGNGRPNCIAFHPTDPNTIFVGFPQGGLWRGTIAADASSAGWTPLTDHLPTLSVGSIAIDPQFPNIMYMLTGDGNRAEGRSIGVLKSFDGGNSWQTTGLSFTRANNQFGYKILINPLRRQTLFVVTNMGVYYSYNSGDSWEQATMTNLTNVPGCYDIEYLPADTNRMVAAGFNFIASSANGGRTWTNRSGQLPAGARRIALAVSPMAPNNVWMYIGRRDSALVSGTMVSRYKGLWRSLNSGETYTLLHNQPNISGYNLAGDDREREQSDIDMDLAVSPTNASIVLAGTHNIWRSTNSGANFGAQAATIWWGTNAAPYIHEDINFIAFHPSGNRAYVGSDGGVYVSTNNGVNWTDLTRGLVISQFYRINVHPTNNDIIVNGAQDAAGNVRVGATSEFKEVNGGDGMSCMIDGGNAQILYTSYAEDLFRSTNGGDNIDNIRPSTAKGPWVTPLAMHPTAPATIFYGSATPDDIFRSTNRGDNWSNIGGSGTDDIITCPSNVDRMYALTNNVIRRSDNVNANPANTVAWTNISNGTNFPAHLNNATRITRLAVNPANSNNIWFCVGGFNDTLKVYRSLNAGGVWQNMSAGLPNVAILSIVHENNESRPGAVYVGTDIGVFYRDNNLNTWTYFSNRLPISPVTDLRINQGSGKLRAATYGRGIWETSLFSVCPSTVTLAAFFTSYNGVRTYQATDRITFQVPIGRGLGDQMHLRAGNYIEFTPGTNIFNGSFLEARIGPCGAVMPSNITPLSIPVDGDAPADSLPPPKAPAALLRKE